MVGLLIALLFLLGTFAFFMIVASWFVESTGAIMFVALFLFACFWSLNGKKK